MYAFVNVNLAAPREPATPAGKVAQPRKSFGERVFTVLRPIPKQQSQPAVIRHHISHESH